MNTLIDVALNSKQKFLIIHGVHINIFFNLYEIPKVYN